MSGTHCDVLTHVAPLTSGTVDSVGYLSFGHIVVGSLRAPVHPSPPQHTCSVDGCADVDVELVVGGQWLSAPPRLRERGLHQILCVMVVTSQKPCGSEQPTALVGHELFEADGFIELCLAVGPGC